MTLFGSGPGAGIGSIHCGRDGLRTSDTAPSSPLCVLLLRYIYIWALVRFVCLRFLLHNGSILDLQLFLFPIFASFLPVLPFLSRAQSLNTIKVIRH